MLGPDIVSASARVSAVQLETRNLWVQTPVAQQLGLPVILVVGMRLGCLNHALLTADAIESCGLRLAGWVANVLDADMLALRDNIAALEQRLAGLGLLYLDAPISGGAAKAAALREIACGEFQPALHPGQTLRAFAPRVTWLADQEAAAQL